MGRRTHLCVSEMTLDSDRRIQSEPIDPFGSPMVGLVVTALGGSFAVTFRGRAT